MTFGGIDEIVKKLEEENKNFCFIYLGHYCNWEWIASSALLGTGRYTVRTNIPPAIQQSLRPALPSPAQPVRRRMHLDEGDAPPNHRIETRHRKQSSALSPTKLRSGTASTIGQTSSIVKLRYSSERRR